MWRELRGVKEAWASAPVVVTTQSGSILKGDTIDIMLFVDGTVNRQAPQSEGKTAWRFD